MDLKCNIASHSAKQCVCTYKSAVKRNHEIIDTLLFTFSSAFHRLCDLLGMYSYLYRNAVVHDTDPLGELSATIICL
jgi:hypothetical protein